MVVHAGILAPPDAPPKLDDTGLNLFFSFGNYGLLNRGFLIHGMFMEGWGVSETNRNVVLRSME